MSWRLGTILYGPSFFARFGSETGRFCVAAAGVSPSPSVARLQSGGRERANCNDLDTSGHLSAAGK
ncbi:MAG: hypothetical protein BRD30_11145 [Bacteroidetes bacterium QH_2_63_10]|nr:MAG: hypothetical protein BRD30_11145 [Bacteroidetes bacterium QH_2_63_10]